MKIVVTNSLGNISKPLTQQLVQRGHSVTVISSKAERQKDISTQKKCDFIVPIFISKKIERIDASNLQQETISLLSSSL